MRLVPVLAALALAAALPAAAATPRVTATLKTSSTAPVVGERWRWTVTARDAAGAPVAARVRLQILAAGSVVGCPKGTSLVHCSGANAGTWLWFRGSRNGVLAWPRQSVGARLSFRADVVAGGIAIRLRAPVSVRPRSL